MPGGAHLVWMDNSDNEDAFELERKPQGGDFARVTRVSFDLNQHHDATVPNGDWIYRIRAVSAGGESAWSNEAAISIGGGNGGSGNTDAGVADAGQIDFDAGVSFRQHVVPLLYRTCGAGTGGCHARDAYFATSNRECRGWLALEDAALGATFEYPDGGVAQTGCPDRTLHQRLVDLKAWMCESPQRRYVVPGDLAASQLWAVTAGDPTAGGACEKAPGVPMTRMPPAPAAALSGQDLEILRRWILDGAADN